MVPPRRVSQQALDQRDGARDPRAGWGNKLIQPPTLGDIRLLLKYAPATGTALLVYAVLLLHADAAGFVTATIAEVGTAAHIHPATTREVLRGLRKHNLLVTVHPGNRWRPATWQVKALHSAAKLEAV
jgi:hypothetical protein